MSTDPVAGLLASVERPVEPRPGFADELLTRLEAELGPTPAPQAAPATRRARRARRPFLGSPVAVAAAVALVVVVVTVLVASPGGRSAAAALADARAAFARLPAVQVAYTTRTSADSRPGLEVAVTTEVRFADSTRWRSTTTAVTGSAPDQVGDFRLADGTYERTFTQDPPLLSVRRLSEVPGLVSASGLGVVSPETVWTEGPREGVPPSTWFEESCDARDTSYLDRPVTHLTCDGDHLQVWLDDATGLVLRVTDVDSEVAVSALDLSPRFASGTFTATVPPGTTVRWDGALPVPKEFASEPSAGLRTIRLQGSNGWALAAGEEGVWAVAQSRPERPFDLLLQRLDADGGRGPVVRLTEQVDTVLVAEGRLWLAAGMDATAQGPSWVRQHDPVTGRALGPRLEVEPKGATSAAMASTPGVLWFTGGARTTRSHGGGRTSDDSALARIDLATGRITHLELGLDAAFVASGFGSVWVALHDWAVDGRPDVTLVRVDPASGKRLASLTVPARGGPPRIVAGDRSLYVTSVTGANQVELLAVDPRSTSVTARRTMPLGAIAFGAGQLWVTDVLRGQVHRLDPATLRTTRTLRVGRSPGAAVITAGSLCVLNGADGTVTVVPLG